MKNLKKFQEFALTQEEQKNVKGGRLIADGSGELPTQNYRCMVSITPTVHTYTTCLSAADAIAYCDARANCMGCEPC